MFYSLDKLKPKTKTKNLNIFVGVYENSMTFLYTFLKGKKVLINSLFNNKKKLDKLKQKLKTNE